MTGAEAGARLAAGRPVGRRAFLSGLTGVGLMAALGPAWLAWDRVGARIGGAAGGPDLATGGSAAASPSGATRGTATVTRRDLVQTVQADGRLGYGAAWVVGGGPLGTITALPTEGTVLDRGASLWEVDGGPGPALFLGDRPAWRTMAAGAGDGEDVRQLEANLIALGFGSARALGPDTAFTSATTAAVKRWQKARGVEQTGRVATADVVFAPGPVRVAGRKAAVGDRSGSGPVLTVTGSEQTVLVKADPAKVTVARAGDPVTVELADSSKRPGTIRSVGTVVQTETGQGAGTSSYVEVVVSLDGGGVAGLDDAPVTVHLTRATATAVLAVPVKALLALSEGGYALERVTPAGTTELVGVTLGPFANGWVQVTGAVVEGDKVVVAP